MPIVLTRAKYVALGAIGLASVCLLGGFAAGRATAINEPVETMVLPPPSMKNLLNNLKPEQFCTRNRAFSDFVKGDDIHIQSHLAQLAVQITAAFDRGVICRMAGEVVRYNPIKGVGSKRPFDFYVLVAATGDSQIMSEEMAKVIAASPAVAAMASNIGNDGTVVPVPKISMIKIDEDS